MSSNLNNNRKQSGNAGRMNSITRRLRGAYVRRRLGGILIGSLLLCILACVGFLVVKEHAALGYFSLHTKRSFNVEKTVGGKVSEIYYTVSPSSENSGQNAGSSDGKQGSENSGTRQGSENSGTEQSSENSGIGQGSGNSELTSSNDAVQIPVLTPLRRISSVCSIICLLRLIGLFFVSAPAYEKKIINLMSPLNELALKADELSRMEFGEDKYHIIEDAISHLESDDSKLSLGDSDLSGIEAAINNMLTRIRESNRQQARFVNDASHELRTPIAVISGYADMLARWGKDDEKVLDESIAAIQKESTRMKHLVEQLLFLARGDSGRTLLQKEDVNLCELMQEAYEESVMIDEDHVYRLSAPEAPLTIQADAGLLKQAVRILIDNAAKYTKEHDEIILSVGEADGHPYLQVQDCGIGMAEADVQHIFERFYRADEARSIEGTGLGLSIAKWIVDKHGGHFEILSRTELGTRIRIVL